jgi:type IV pilus assembly protein PilB
MERSIPWLKNETLSDDERRHALSHELGVPFVTLERDDISIEALQMLPEPLCRSHNLVAYKESGDKLEVALLDLADLDSLEPLRAQLGKKIVPRLTTRESLRRALLLYQKTLKAKYGDKLLRETNPQKALDTLLQHANAQRASEVQIETTPRGVLVRYRHGHTLREAIVLPASAVGIIGAIRSLANVGSKTMPQEGRFKTDLGSGVSVSVRVSSVPVMGGEKLILRFLREDSGSKGFTLEGLGFHGAGAASLRATLHARKGLVLVAGTAGSGRTTLLYTLLDMLNTPELSLASIEEKVSNRLPYVAQTEVQPNSGLSMAAALRAALRQDPDVVMLDSITDRDTAELAKAAASRGLLIFASAANESVVPGADVLVRTAVVHKLCDKQTRDTHALERRHLEPLEPHADFAKVLAALKEEEQISKDVAWKDVRYSTVTGCSECEGGYVGRTGLFEVVTPAESGLNLLEDALYKAAAGLTSVAEVLRFAQERTAEVPRD